MKTIRQFAEEIGITRQAMYKRVMKLPYETYFTAEDKTIYLTEEAELILKEADAEKKRKKEMKRLSDETETKKQESPVCSGNSESEIDETFCELSVDKKLGETDGEKVVSGNRSVSGFVSELKHETETLLLKLSAAEDTIRSLTVSEEELRESCAFFRRQMDEKDAQIKALLEQNASLTRALSDAMDSTKGAQALHASDIMRIESAEAKEPEKKKRKFPFFGK